jgi:hypothetical protein
VRDALTGNNANSQVKASKFTVGGKRGPVRYRGPD